MDLQPVGLRGACRIVVQGGLDLVATGVLNSQRGLQHALAFGDLAGVPQSAVLPVERDDATLWVESRRESGLVKEHQREQPACFRFIGGEGDLARKPYRLGG
jgi:hypothetical protein